MLPKKRRMYSNNGGSLSVWDQAQFFAPLKTTLVLSRGTGNPTFTRATTAYVTDFEGLLKQVPSGCARFTGARIGINWLVNSEVPAKVGSVTLTAGQTDPLGGTAAYKVVYGAASSSDRVIYSASGGNPVGITGNISIWMRGEIGGEQVKLWNGWGVDVVTHTLTTTWKRYTFSFTTDSSISVMIYATAGTPTIYTAFAQGEASGSSIPYEYVSVGVLSAPYHGAGVDYVKYFDTENGNTVNSGIVTEATGAAIADATLDGYLAEGQRQNRCLYSQDFTNAAWVSGGGGIAVTPNTAVAPDGTTTADTLTASGANGTLIQDLGVVASAAKAGGLYLKRKTGTGNIDLTLDGGSTWTTVAVTSSWLLLEKTQTLADEDFGIRIVTSGDEVYAWQAQVETAAFISSPIPTTTAAVTRNGDVLSYPSAGNIAVLSPYTIYAEWQVYADINNNQNLVGSSVNYAPYFSHQTTTSNFLTIFSNTGDSAAVYTLSGAVANVARKGACSRDATNIKSVAEGGTVASAINGTETAEVTSFQIGSHAGLQQLFGTIKNARIWTKALPDAQLESITT